jgi:hypothetical protein
MDSNRDANKTAFEGKSSTRRLDLQETVDEDMVEDHDSAYDSQSIDLDTKTLSSTVTKYRFENGRRYHAYKDGSYWVR